MLIFISISKQVPLIVMPKLPIRQHPDQAIKIRTAFLNNQTSGKNYFFPDRNPFHPFNSFSFHCLSKPFRLHTESCAEHLWQYNNFSWLRNRKNLFLKHLEIRLFIFPLKFRLNTSNNKRRHVFNYFIKQIKLTLFIKLTPARFCIFNWIVQLPNIMVFNIPFAFFISIIAFTACVIDKERRQTIEPKEFKTALAFEIRDGKLFIPTYWGKEKVKQLLAFDTHAPTWA